MLEALCRQSSTTLDIVHAEDGPPITQRTSGLDCPSIRPRQSHKIGGIGRCVFESHIAPRVERRTKRLTPGSGIAQDLRSLAADIAALIARQHHGFERDPVSGGARLDVIRRAILTQSFFDKVSQSWLMRFIAHRIGDVALLRDWTELPVCLRSNPRVAQALSRPPNHR